MIEGYLIIAGAIVFFVGFIAGRSDGIRLGHAEGKIENVQAAAFEAGVKVGRDAAMADMYEKSLAEAGFPVGRFDPEPIPFPGSDGADA